MADGHQAGKKTAEHGRAPLWKRLAAVFIDHLIITFFFGAWLFLYFGLNRSKLSPTVSLRGIGLGLVLIFLLYLVKDLPYGRSPGRMITGTAVRDAKDNAKIPGPGRLIARNAMLAAWPVEFFLLLCTASHRRSGDTVTGTDVVEIKRGG
ncbi:MAG: RDD family protein [Bacillota bacterium]